MAVNDDNYLAYNDNDVDAVNNNNCIFYANDDAVINVCHFAYNNDAVNNNNYLVNDDNALNDDNDLANNDHNNCVVDLFSDKAKSVNHTNRLRKFDIRNNLS